MLCCPRPVAAREGPLMTLAISRRSYRYSPFNTIRATQKQREKAQATAYPYAGGGMSKATEGETKKSSIATSSSSGGAGSGIRRRAGATGVRPLQSAAQDREDAKRIFPETLPSGRPAQQNTIAQQLIFQNTKHETSKHSHHVFREAYVEQQNREKALEQLQREAQKRRHSSSGAAASSSSGSASASASSNSGTDSRFFQKIKDYREIGDPDAYASIFGESKTTEKVRTAFWQRQFEEENKDVFLPYERDTRMKRLVPNWFVRYFLRMRDSGGADNLYGLYLCAVVALSLLWFVGIMFYTAPSRTRPLSEVK